MRSAQAVQLLLLLPVAAWAAGNGRANGRAAPFDVLHVQGSRVYDALRKQVLPQPPREGLLPHRITDLPRMHGSREGGVQSGDKVQLELPLETCFSHKGQMMCAQKLTEPSCPREYAVAARQSCLEVAGYLNDNQTTTVAELRWWTTSDCLVHRTRCDVVDPKHDEQVEDFLYDFKDHCDDKSYAEYSMLYKMVQEDGTLLERGYHGTATLQHGKEVLLVTIKDRGLILREEHLALRLYDVHGPFSIGLRTEGLDRLRATTSSGAGLYGQYGFRVRALQKNGRIEQGKFTFNYKVSNDKTLAKCPPAKQQGFETGLEFTTERNHDPESPVAIILAVVGVVVVLALISYGVHFYLMKRREYYAKQAELHARTITVAQNGQNQGASTWSATPCEASQTTCGYVTSGVVIEMPPAGVPVGAPVAAVGGQQGSEYPPALSCEEDGGCTAAPLPPPIGEQS